jgi:hypothetical protein
MSALCQPKPLRRGEVRLIVVFTREPRQKKPPNSKDHKRLAPDDHGRLEAYGRAFNAAGLVFTEIQLPGLLFDIAPFLTAQPVIVAMSQLDDFPLILERTELRDISLRLTTSREQLRQEARSQQPPVCLDAYLLTDQKFSAILNQLGQEIKLTLEQIVSMANSQDLPLVCLDSCLLTVGLLAWLSNNTPAERRKLVARGCNSHPQIRVQLVNEESPNPVDQPLAVELVCRKDDQELLQVAYLNDANFMPLGKAKP